MAAVSGIIDTVNNVVIISDNDSNKRLSLCFEMVPEMQVASWSLCLAVVPVG